MDYKEYDEFASGLKRKTPPQRSLRSKLVEGEGINKKTMPNFPVGGQDKFYVGLKNFIQESPAAALLAGGKYAEMAKMATGVANKPAELAGKAGSLVGDKPTKNEPLGTAENPDNKEVKSVV